jgi:DNA repair protein RadA/Sms
VWNALAEAPRPSSSRRRGSPPAREPRTVLPLHEAADAARTDRLRTGIGEFDFVIGGGLVPGSLLLVGGEPGIGKSTLLLQAAAGYQAAGVATLYVSGEESAAQVRLRADRVGQGASDVPFLAETDLDAILDCTDAVPGGVVFIDSIQTMKAADTDGAPGNVTQIRECAARFQRRAKESGIAIVLVGHVTKDGVVAGPKMLEHMVDTVLYFEGSAGLDHRVLRATKNRFGGVDEIGVFRMTPAGLLAADDPSAVFLSSRTEQVSGSAVLAGIEGTRPLLVEIQALCTRTSYGAPQRVADGFDRQRLALLLAVLERRAGVAFGSFDVFLNVAGGVRVSEPAADLAVAAALVSAARDLPVPEGAVFAGEVGLGGEVRPVGQVERRLAEAGRLGFRRGYVPESADAPRVRGLHVVHVIDLAGLVEEAFA